MNRQNKSKSTDWTEVSLEVPDDNVKKYNAINEEIPKPPPRKHKKGLREKIESVAKTGLQALNINNNKKPVEEPLCVKETIDYSCPCDDPNHDHNKMKQKSKKNEFKLPKGTPKLSEKIAKRRKNLSVISLPNYNELKFSIANSDSKIDKDLQKHNSVSSLPDESKKFILFKKDNYKARVRSFGSILPNQLLEKLKHSKTPADIESDDSFGPLEDWDLKIIEHYNPKDTSLPRARKLPRTEKDVLNNVENMIVTDEEITQPIPPVRRSESLVKKMNRSTVNESITTKNDSNKAIEQNELSIVRAAQLPTEDEEGKVEHSTLMKILEEFSIKEKQKAQNDLNNINSTQFIIDNSNKTFSHPVEEFLSAERAS